MQDFWNEQSYLNESVENWMNKYCPGLMVILNEPHQFGNEYSIAGEDKSEPVMWRIELAKRKD